jgi:hypothetical protein
VSNVRIVRHLLACAAALCWTPAAVAATPLSAEATPAAGAAPLNVTLAAAPGAVEYRWDFGDGATAEGRVVDHTYAAGAYDAVVTARAANGELTHTTVRILAFGVELTGPSVVRYGSRAAFRGRLVPAFAGATVVLTRDGADIATARTGRNGEFRRRLAVRLPGLYAVRFGQITSSPVAVRVRPLLHVSVRRIVLVGEPLRITAKVVPADAGALRVEVWQGRQLAAARTSTRQIRLQVQTKRTRSFRITVTVESGESFADARRTVRTHAVLPRLQIGTRGPAVRMLEQLLAARAYSLRPVDERFGRDTYEAVLAFQKVHGLRRTGRVDRAVWRRLRNARRPLPRVFGGGTHLEVDKRRQVLFDVRRGRVVRALHVSTGATGNTPLGRWRVYRKVRGWDWILWYPMYFLRGFAIHGYPSVPAWPASHGCVRVPMWIAPTLYAEHPHGTSVYVF